MQDERLFDRAMINPFWAKPHLPGHRRPWHLLTACLAALGLLLAFLAPAAAAPPDGTLDLSFITGSGQYAGVQTIPEIRGQAGYNTGGPYNGYQLLFGTFWGVQVGNTYPPDNGGNSCIARLDNNGNLDPTFSTNYQINGEIRSVYIYPHNVNDPNSDKILIGGSFNVSAPGGGGYSYYVNFARLGPNGNLDTTLTQTFWYGGAVNAVAVLDSGKILLGGYDLRTGNQDGPTYQLICLNSDGGSQDPNYIPWGAPGGYISGIKIVSGDPLFGNGVRLWCSYPKNQNGTGGTYYVLFLNSNATRPDIIPPVASVGDELVDGPVVNSARQSDNKLLICGQFRNVKNSGIWLPRKSVARLNYSAGAFTLDTTYDVGVGPNGPVTQISPVMANPPSYDDRMVLSGHFTTWNNAPCGYLARLTTSGTLDTNFPPGSGGHPGLAADDRISKLYWNPDGTGGMIWGYFRNYNGQARGGIAALNADGSYNPGFGNVTAQAGWPGMVYSLATQSDGKIIIGGNFNGVGGKFHPGIARIYPNGSLDPSFMSGVDIGMNSAVKSVAVQADGKILLGGYFGQCNMYSCTSLARLNPNGSLDTTFKPMLVGDDNSLNQVYHVLPLANGQMMIAGDIWNNTGGAPVARLNSDGSLDSTFWSNVANIPNPIPGSQWSWGTRVAVVGGNYILAGGYGTGNNNYWNNSGFLGRLIGTGPNAGTIDTSFGPTAPAPHIQTMDGEVDDLLLQPDGKIVVSGGFSHIYSGSGSPPARSAVARFSANGLLDTTFTTNISLPTGANALLIPAMARQPNGKILVEGSAFNNNANGSTYVASAVGRLNADGSEDFNNFLFSSLAGGYFYYGGGNSILRLPNGKALIGGCYSTYNTTPAWSLVRIFAGPANFSPGELLLLLGD